MNKISTRVWLLFCSKITESGEDTEGGWCPIPPAHPALPCRTVSCLLLLLVLVICKRQPFLNKMHNSPCALFWLSDRSLSKHRKQSAPASWKECLRTNTSLCTATWTAGGAQKSSSPSSCVSKGHQWWQVSGEGENIWVSTVVAGSLQCRKERSQKH